MVVETVNKTKTDMVQPIKRGSVSHQASTRLSLLGIFFILLIPFSSYGLSDKHHVKDNLEFGTILYEFYQNDFFSSLVRHAYASSHQNPHTLVESGQLLKGGMLLSYGIPQGSKEIFDRMLDNSESDSSRNAAWYYLAKLFYSKSEIDNAKQALERVKGQIPKSVHVDYHYLSTLIGAKGKHLEDSRNALEKIKKNLPQYPYFLFNYAIRTLNDGNLEEATQTLKEVTEYAYLGEEYEVLADRAKHGLSKLAASQEKLLESWQLLSDIRTTGLYSNRALISYAWAAIKLQQYKEAIPALEILDARSIALPEVQETKVLLAHLYEQDGLKRKALKQNVIAEQALSKGLDMLGKARAIIAQKDVPGEFISNLDNVVSETDWYGERPEIDYRHLTPFLIDLLSENTFNETLKELADLYAIEKNLKYWLLQSEQHLIILNENKKKKLDQQTKRYIASGKKLSTELEIKNQEIQLLLLSLPEEDQRRFSTLIESTDNALEKLTVQIKSLGSIQSPYQVPEQYAKLIQEKEIELKSKLKRTQSFIVKLEKAVRKLVNLELDKHESRMSYYAAQARLAKARLYDAALLDLESAKKRVQPNSAGKNKTEDDIQ